MKQFLLLLLTVENMAKSESCLSFFMPEVKACRDTLISVLLLVALVGWILFGVGVSRRGAREYLLDVNRVDGDNQLVFVLDRSAHRALTLAGADLARAGVVATVHGALPAASALRNRTETHTLAGPFTPLVRTFAAGSTLHYAYNLSDGVNASLLLETVTYTCGKHCASPQHTTDVESPCVAAHAGNHTFADARVETVGFAPNETGLAGSLELVYEHRVYDTAHRVHECRAYPCRVALSSLAPAADEDDGAHWVVVVDTMGTALAEPVALAMTTEPGFAVWGGLFVTGLVCGIFFTLLFLVYLIAACCLGIDP